MSKVPPPALRTFKHHYQSCYMKNPATLDLILDKIQVEKRYEPDTKILDVYSANGFWSASLYNRILPQQHVLMESRKECNQFLEEYLSKLPSNNKFDLKKLDPYAWSSFLDITDRTKLLQPDFQSREALHSNFLFTGYVTNEGLLMQWLACIANQNWIQRFGLVKMLLWVPNSSALKIMAYPDSTTRSKCSLLREAYSNTKLVAIPDDLNVQKYSPLLLEKDQPILINPADYSNAKIPLALLEIDPVDHEIDTYTWDFVVKQLMTSRTRPLTEVLGFLGPAATEFFSKHFSHEFLERTPSSLTAEEFNEIVTVFSIWPFKPSSLLESIDGVREL